MIFGVLSEDELDNNDENTSGGVDKNIDIDSMADKSSSSSSCLDDDDDDDEISTDTETGYTLNSNIDADNSTTSIIIHNNISIDKKNQYHSSNSETETVDTQSTSDSNSDTTSDGGKRDLQVFKMTERYALSVAHGPVKHLYITLLICTLVVSVVSSSLIRKLYNGSQSSWMAY